MSDLVEQLRDEAYNYNRELLDGAADKIEELTAERDDYKDRWEQTGCTRHGALEAAIRINTTNTKRIAKLEADNKALRDALKKIIKAWDGDSDSMSDDPAEIALAALRGES